MTPAIFKKALLLLITYLFISGVSQGANRYWIANSTGLWNNSANWSTASGGAGGASIPGTSDKAIFNSGGIGNCTVSSAVSVGGVQIASTYPGVITHSSGTFGTGALNFIIGGGTFSSSSFFNCTGTFTINGGTFTLTGSVSFNNTFSQTAGTVNLNTGANPPSFSNNFNLSGGTFNCTPTTTNYLGTSFTVSGGTFNQTGTFRFATSATMQINVNQILQFSDLQFSGNSASTTFNLNGDTLQANGMLSFTGSSRFSMQNGALYAKGNLSITNTYTATNVHTAILLINGTIDQSISSSVSAGSGRLPDITIRKNNGNLLLSGPISVEGNWNYLSGNVIPQTSSINFYNSSKFIDGEGSSSTMNFYDIVLGDGNTRTMNGDIVINNSLSLQTGKIDLNSNTLFIQNGVSTALSYSTGGLISENTGNNSKVSWNIGTNTGAHTIPFENISNFDIPFTFNLVSGDAGTLTVSTYPTAANNTPYPITPQTVTNVNTTGGIDNSANTVNRFWQIDKTGANPVANLTFTYGDNEWDSSEPSDYNAQRYDDVTDIWQPALPSQIHNTTTNTVYVPNVSTFSPWTLSRTVSPLAIDMADYIVALPNENTIVSWLMGNESDVYEYHIEKTTDFNDVELLKIESSGKSAYSFEDKNTWTGVSYYRVRAFDINGNSTDFEWKKVEKKSEINRLLAFPNPVSSDQNLMITGIENSSETVSVGIFDLNGKQLFSENLSSSSSVISLTVPQGISQGCYILVVNGQNLKLFVR